VTRHFLSDDDLAPDEQNAVLDLAAAMKADRFRFQPLTGPKSVAVLFDKPSLRTRMSFEAGIAELGGNPIIVDTQNTHFGRGESLADAGRVVSRYVSAIVMRTHGDHRLAELASDVRVPVVNALTDGYHPCQLLADLLTIREHRGDLAGQTLTFLGDGACNMAQSYLLAGATAGMHVRIASPANYSPAASVVADARAIAQRTGGSIALFTNPTDAVAGSDVVVTDTWVSMGKEKEKAQRLTTLDRYQVDAELMALAKPDALFLHCLPADRGFEVTAEVIDGPQSVIWDEAENRLHAQKALMVWLLEQNGGGPGGNSSHTG
jgi:ornithine carbamoyltransferase